MSILSYHRTRNQIKADQAWEMAGLARQDGDLADEKRWTQEARKYAQLAREEAQQ